MLHQFPPLAFSFFAYVRTFFTSPLHCTGFYLPGAQYLRCASHHSKPDKTNTSIHTKSFSNSLPYFPATNVPQTWPPTGLGGDSLTPGARAFDIVYTQGRVHRSRPIRKKYLLFLLMVVVNCQEMVSRCVFSAYELSSLIHPLICKESHFKLCRISSMERECFTLSLSVYGVLTNVRGVNTQLLDR